MGKDPQGCPVRRHALDPVGARVWAAAVALQALRANDNETSSPGSLALRVLKDDFAHAHDPDPDRR